MLNGAVANRYASALYALARDTNQVDQFENELSNVVKSVKASPEFLEFLTHPKVSTEDKKAKLEAAFQSVVSQPVLNFLKLLVDKKRETYLSVIYDQFVDLVDKATGRIKAHMESAYELTSEQINTISSQLQASCGKTVVLTTSVNPDLIGGVRIRFGDRVIDASIKGQLTQFRESLKRQQVS